MTKFGREFFSSCLQSNGEIRNSAQNSLFIYFFLFSCCQCISNFVENMLEHGNLQWTTEVTHWNSTFEPLTKLLSSCMGSYRAYLTGVVMQRGSIVFLSLTYTWQPEALPLQHRFIGYCYAKDSIVFLNLKYPWQPEAHSLTGTTDVINLASVLAGQEGW